MILRWAFLMVFYASSVFVTAQPTLPDIAARNESGAIVLNWNCQFDKLKSVRVRRSADSVSGFNVVGELFSLHKGIQSFTDSAPLHGDSYYKLLITFSSGLTWSSNHVHVYLAGHPGVVGGTTYITPAAGADVGKISVAAPPPGRLGSDAFVLQSGQKVRQTVRSVAVPVWQSYRDSTVPVATVPAKTLVKLRYHAIADTADEPDLFLNSKYVSVDPVSRNVLISLPDNARLLHYSMRIYDEHHKLIWEIPVLREARIIMDKRNFQRKGVYSFILKKDRLEMDRGNFIIR